MAHNGTPGRGGYFHNSYKKGNMGNKRHNQAIPTRAFKTVDDVHFKDITCTVFPWAGRPEDPGRVWTRGELEELRRRGVFVSVVHPPVARLWHPGA